ncbi:MAG: phosphoadenylyl-sulfate reductase [Planctomycetaceae bacterium]|nr:phosphoadenylyl-sulfate reductase [Planctomycetaceae bacterium]
MPLLTQGELANLNSTMESRTPLELMVWAKTIFGQRAAVLSSMQQAGCMVCHMAAVNRIEMPVLFVDTGVLFPETLATRDRLIGEYGLKVITLSPRLTMEQQTAQLGVLYLTPDGQSQCCEMRKTDPLMSIAGQYDALVASLRRGDGERRRKVPILAVDPKMNCLRVNILANVTDQELYDYLEKHKVITNPLHAQGYSTIGCVRCTTPVLSDEPKRAGRWRHLGPWAMYCGINPTDLDGGTEQAIDLPADLIDQILGRKVDFAI